MKRIHVHLTKNVSAILGGTLALGIALGSQPARATGPLLISPIPLFLTLSNQPNILVVYDNSQSMDGTMAGMLIAGSDPTTRGNIAKAQIVNSINNYRTAFNWGLETFGISGNPSLMTTYAYYLGNSTTMVFTNDCVNGISATNNNLRCIAAPQNNNGYNYVTYSLSGDDPSINDVLYTSNFGAGAWAVSPNATSGTNYDLFNSHDGSTNWGVGNFSNATFGFNPIGFTPTDAGYLPSTAANPAITRQVYKLRAWGYYGNPTGSGKIVETVQADSTTHYNNLMAALAPETNTNSSEIKDGAVYTPLAGSIATANAYFSGSLSSTSSPIQYACQKNFVLLATDGNPTGKTDGTQYDPSQWANATSGQAYLDLYSQISALRNITYGGSSYDVQTYVIGLGSTVANPTSIAGLNQIATLGGTGSAYLASDQTSLQSALQSISSDIISKIAAAGSVALNSQSITTNSMVYQGRFSSADWSGQLLALPIGSTGALGSAQWDAGAVLNTLDYSSGRAILTIKPSSHAGIPFRWPANSASPGTNELDATQVTALNTSPSNAADTLGSARLNYLRGSVADESPNGNRFRPRYTSKLGDLVDSAPLWVGAPAANYSDAGYAGFRTAYLNREPLVYVGSNDGMLHAFDANSGVEKLAYVPAEVYSNLTQLTSTTYSHRYFVDGSPSVNDAVFGGNWHTVLVGGLEGGGKAYYALDITDPSHFSEANASSIVLWEFGTSSDADMGLSYSRPTIAKINTGGYAAIFGNGYNNGGSGQAVLYVVDIGTGNLIRKITTGVGTTANPNGLSNPIAIDRDGNRTVDSVYAGDLQGNLWKFNLSDTNPANWGVAYTNAGSPAPLFTARDSLGNPQPITTTPDVGAHPNGGNLVFFGTGMYLQLADVTNTQQQTVYGVWDNGAPVGSGSLLQQTVTGTVTSGSNTYRVLSQNAINWSSYKGWYVNLPTSGERVQVDPFLRNGRVIVTTTIPSNQACTYGGSSWLMELNYLSGGAPTTPVFDVNGDAVVSKADTVTSSGVAVYPGGMKINAIGSTPSVEAGLGTSTQPSEMKYINQSSGVVTNVMESGSATGSHRTSWRQVK